MMDFGNLDQAEMPDHLDRILVKILKSWHRGRDKAISRFALLRVLNQQGFSNLNERLMREQIKRMRRRGYLIGSAAGEGGGYFWCVTREEYEEFMQAEYRAKVADMAETIRAMDQAAEREFGPDYQPSLF